MQGTLVNTIAVIIGGILGSFLGNRLMENYKKIVMQALSLAVILIGLEMALETNNIIYIIFSLMLGALMGEFIGIEAKLAMIGSFFEEKFAKNSQLADGFVKCSLIYCVGAMAIMGAIQDGLGQEPTILYTKSLLDGFSAIAFASSLGPGVILSALTILIYQGSITLLAGQLELILTTEIITEMSAVGGLLIMAIGLNMLEIINIKVGNLLPAIFTVIILLLII